MQLERIHPIDYPVRGLDRATLQFFGLLLRRRERLALDETFRLRNPLGGSASAGK